MFNIVTDELSNSKTIYCSTHNHYIPLDPANRHYQEVLDAIIEQGAACFDGDIPAELQAAADEKQFNQQLAAYRVAVLRLEKYRLADGRAEQTFEEPSGEYDDEGNEIMHTWIIAGIEPLPTQVEETTYGEEGNATTAMVDNPEIVRDDAERAAAQAVVDATPDEVKTY